MKECEVEKCRIIEQLKFLEGQKDVTVVTSTGGNVDLQKSVMSIDEMLRYRHKVLQDLDVAVGDLDMLRNDDDGCLRAIDFLERDLLAIVNEKTNLIDKIRMLQLRIDDGASLIHRDTTDLRWELKRQKSFLGTKVLWNSVQKAIRR